MILLISRSNASVARFTGSENGVLPVQGWRASRLPLAILCHAISVIHKRFSTFCASVLDLFNLTFSSPAPPTLMRKNTSFFNT